MKMHKLIIVTVLTTSCGQVAVNRPRTLTIPQEETEEKQAQKPRVIQSTHSQTAPNTDPLSEESMNAAIEASTETSDVSVITGSMGVEFAEGSTAQDTEQTVPEDITMGELQSFAFNHFMTKTDNDSEISEKGSSMVMNLVAMAQTGNPFKMSKASKEIKKYAKETNESKGDVFKVIKTVAGICAIIAGTMAANPFAIALGVVLIL